MKKIFISFLILLTNVGFIHSEINSGICGDSLTWTLSDEFELTISGTGAMYDYEWNSPWSEYKYNIWSVIIEEGVTTIGSTAFRDHIYLQQCSLPSTLVSIGNEAFCFCFQLISVEIPASCVSIVGYGAFNTVPNVVTQNEELLLQSGARSINGYVEGYFVYADSSKKSLRACSSAVSGEIELDDAIERIEYNAFAQCTNITHIRFGSHLQYIGEWSLNGCTGLEILQFEEGLIEIADNAFGNCFGLREVYLPNSLTTLGNFSIGNCPYLRTIHLGTSLTTCGMQIFDSCQGLDTIFAFMSTPPILDNTAFGASDRAHVICYVPLQSLSLYQQASVWSEMNLQPIDATEECNIAFGACGENLTWELDCEGVLTIEGTGDMWNYPEYSIPWYEYRDQINTVVVGSGLTKWSDNSFSGCNYITAVHISDLEAWCKIKCYNSTYDISPLHNDGHLYLNGSEITELTIPNTVDSIGDWAFVQCSNITSVNVPEGVKYIGRGSFNNTGITQISLPSSLTGIGWAVFLGCNNLKNITIPQNVTSIEDYTFRICLGLESVTIGDGVTDINSWAFSGCSNLKTVVYGRNVRRIGKIVFGDCTSLTSIDLPESVISIDEYAFYNCIGITSITSRAITPPTVGENAFGNVDKSIPLYVPGESIETYKITEQWKDFTNILPIPGTEISEKKECEINYLNRSSDIIDSETLILNMPIAPSINGFTFLKWVIVSGDLDDGINIQAVYVANTPTEVPTVYTNPNNTTQKLIKNGNVYILSDEKIYTISGKKIK